MLLLMLCSFGNITFLKYSLNVVYRRLLYVLHAIPVLEAVYILGFSVS